MLMHSFRVLQQKQSKHQLHGREVDLVLRASESSCVLQRCEPYQSLIQEQVLQKFHVLIEQGMKEP